MRLRFLIASLGLSLLAAIAPRVDQVAGGHESLSALLASSPLEGSRLFAEKGCLGCHAIHGVGGTTGPDLGRGILDRPLLEIAAVMWNHAPGMERAFEATRRPRPTFEPQEMASLLSFLYYLGSLDVPGDAERGGLLFREKGCEICHSVGGSGGHVGPDLTKYSRYASPLFLTASLWNRGRAMAAAMEARNVTRPVFQGNDIPDLLAYIRSAGGGTERIYAPPGNPKRGETLFTQKRCVECHSVRGHGGNVGPDLAIVLKGSLMRIAGTMWNHGPKMWAKMAERGIEVPSLSTSEMSDVISYLYFFQFIDAPGDPRRGRAIFKDKRCGGCHGGAGSGARAPSLAEVGATLKTPVMVITAIWNHSGRMTQPIAEEYGAWPVLKGGEMADLVAYVLEAQGGPSGAAHPKGPISTGPGTQPGRAK